jgi:hypothetical protein
MDGCRVSPCMNYTRPSPTVKSRLREQLSNDRTRWSNDLTQDHTTSVRFQRGFVALKNWSDASDRQRLNAPDVRSSQTLAHALSSSYVTADLTWPLRVRSLRSRCLSTRDRTCRSGRTSVRSLLFSLGLLRAKIKNDWTWLASVLLSLFLSPQSLHFSSNLLTTKCITCMHMY